MTPLVGWYASAPGSVSWRSSELGHAVLEYDGPTGDLVREFVMAHGAGLRDPTFIVHRPNGTESCPRVFFSDR